MALQTKTVSTGDYAWKSWSNSYVISLTLTEESTDIAANTSLVSYLFTISNTNNNRFIANYNSWTISIGGQDIAINNFNFNLGENYTTQTIASGQVTVAHNADGMLNMPYDVSIPNIQSWNQYGPPAMSLSGTWALTSIPRVSEVSCPVGTIGKNVTISIKKADEGLTHTLTYYFGSLSGTIVANTAQKEVSWTILSDFYSQIPNAKRGVGAIVCKTYSGGAFVGESQCQLIADVDEDACRPAVTAQVVDAGDVTTALTGDENVLIRYYSDAKVGASYSAKNGATITDFGFSHNGKTHATSSATIQAVESGAFDFYVTDSRGLSANLSVTKPVIPYVKLTCNLSDNKPDTDGNMTVSVSGNYFDGSFGAVSNKLTVQYRYKVSGTAWQDTEEEWHSVGHTTIGNTYTGEASVTGLDYQTAYTFQARAIDQLATTQSIEYTARATPVFDWGERDFAIHGDLQVDGSVSVEGRPVLNTPDVQTYFWQTEGKVSLENVADFMSTRTADCAFVLMIRGNDYPFVGMAVGVVHSYGTCGAFSLYDVHNGVQSRRLVEGVLYSV